MKINEMTKAVGLTQFMHGGHEALMDENFVSKRSAENHYLYSRVGEIKRIASVARIEPYEDFDEELPSALAQIVLEVMNLASAFGIDLEKHVEMEFERLAARLLQEKEDE